MDIDYEAYPFLQQGIRPARTYLTVFRILCVLASNGPRKWPCNTKQGMKSIVATKFTATLKKQSELTAFKDSTLNSILNDMCDKLPYIGSRLPTQPSNTNEAAIYYNMTRVKLAETDGSVNFDQLLTDLNIKMPNIKTIEEQETFDHLIECIKKLYTECARFYLKIN